MIYATLDVEWWEDAAYLDLRDENIGHPDRFLHMVGWAKRCNEKGRVLRADGIPLDARSMARMHDGRGEEHVATWQAFLDQALRNGLLIFDRDHNCYQIAHWTRWHRPPSAEPEAVAARVAQHRESKRTSSDRNEVKRPVTSCNGCNDTEQSRAKQRQSKDIDKAEHTPPTPPARESRPGGSAQVFASFSPEARKHLLITAAKAYAKVEDGREIYDQAQQKLVKVENTRDRDFPTADFQVLADVLTYAADQVAHEKQTGTFTGRDPWACTVDRASKPELINQRIEWGKAAARGKNFGQEARPFKFRPKEAS